MNQNLRFYGENVKSKMLPLEKKMSYCIGYYGVNIFSRS